MASRSEIEKLVLLAGPGGSLDLAMVRDAWVMVPASRHRILFMLPLQAIARD